MLDPGHGRTKKGYFWAVARDDRPWGGTDPPAVAFTYAPGRGAIHALKLLDRYRVSVITLFDGPLSQLIDGSLAGGAVPTHFKRAIVLAAVKDASRR